ncbi:hypothetical protein PHYPSEUDO_009541 [Phytophthora pseudosyringae]|uniref:Uncharacterized protein n=1 Tax=Phytophthora pseudosyringae TaxID=221518 RepID=A0A8T1WHK5_9STRA|nr:hypothetical protein PHYPSEUDO_009541 [Phytophthora pseudosyringae]
MADLYWDEDGVGGSASSMAVLLQWLSEPGNAECWQRSSGKREETRRILVKEIHESLLAHGIKHRTRGSVDIQICELMHSFEKVERWLQRKGLRHLEPNSRAEHKVVKACPYYRELSHVLNSSRSAADASSQTHRRYEVSTGTAKDVGYSDEDEAGLPDIDSKRVPSSDKGKRAGMEHDYDHVEMGDADRTRLLEAEKAVRRELFKVELQSKSDEAICVRVKSRMELLDLGISIDEVDRLMPLPL